MSRRGTKKVIMPVYTEEEEIKPVEMNSEEEEEEEDEQEIVIPVTKKKPVAVTKKRKIAAVNDDDDEEITVKPAASQTELIFDTSFDFGKPAQVFPLVVKQRKNVTFHCVICGIKLVKKLNHLTCPVEKTHMPVQISTDGLTFALINDYFKCIYEVPVDANTSQLAPEYMLTEKDKRFPLLICTMSKILNGKKLSCHSGQMAIQTNQKWGDSYGTITFRCGKATPGEKCQYGISINGIIELMKKEGESSKIYKKLFTLIDAINIPQYMAVTSTFRKEKVQDLTLNDAQVQLEDNEDDE